ncbi:MAG: polyphosphate kinase [Alphaproteobacteria bacterium]|nr:polyphosphate kinase [Alphaproteobacteria bacterium]MBU0796484.1 polyphosphate kinase [Alphaproteobacteria bacterium]MBU0887631.1 polyphosphate kinase [Alphaproteobacteria bacterium]MBU1812942.1 polyphosphate kinase [Alphaproteobacteria bacterium]MBU2089428.1 polyphosphate kinase [Alphaproteobacteria bacterium]
MSNDKNGRLDQASKHFQADGRPKLAGLKNDYTLDDSEYDDRLKSLQKQLELIQQAYLGSRERAVIVLEGWDTAGKGGLVKRLGWTLDPRSFHVHPIGAPTEEELRQHYLQRFWRKLPSHSRIVLFDRSWYGRVMVERVEKFTPEKDWKRGYREIVEFERQLTDDGVRLVKLFLHISPEEQLKRFRDRLENPLKRWKLTYEDFRNRARWKEYEDAIEEMIEKTSTDSAPWHLIPANDKPFARIAGFQIIADRLGKGLDTSPKPLSPEVLAAAKDVL